MPSKRNTIPAAQELAGPRRRSKPAPETRPLRGAAVHPAPRKTELHHVSLAPRPPPGREQIARRAYEIWLQTGCVAGRETENWLQAERELWTGCGSAQQS